MVMRNRLDCVVALLANEIEIDLRDNEGKTSLHIAVEKKLVPIVQTLVVFGCDINAVNNNGVTPRHMVGKTTSNGKDDQILYILHSVGSKRCCESSSKSCHGGCSATGTYNGIPPEAIESHEAREHIQLMLASTSNSQQRPSLAVAAERNVIDVTQEQQRGQTIMDHLMGMFTRTAKADGAPSPPKRDSPTEALSTDTPLVTTSIPDVELEAPGDHKSPTKSSSAKDRGRLLCLDGGGIRGLVLVQMLLEIEKLSQTPIRNMFDWMAGTSTGGILALGMGSGKTMRELLGLYLRMKEFTFVGSRPYPSEILEKLLKDYLGANSVMTDIVHPKIMVTGVMADRKPVCLHLFRNYKSPTDILGIATTIREFNLILFDGLVFSQLRIEKASQMDIVLVCNSFRADDLKRHNSVT